MNKAILLAALIVPSLGPAESVAAAPAKPLPLIPADCSEQIEANGLLCSRVTVNGPTIDVVVVGIADKELFPTAASLEERYLAFEQWPDYVASSTQKTVTYKAGGSVALPVTVDEFGRKIYGQFFDYDLNVQGIPYLRQNVKGVTFNYPSDPYLGAISSIEFVAQPGPVPPYTEKLKGMKSQTGSVHVLECTNLSVCDDTKWMVIYQTTVQPDISFAMNFVAKTIEAGIEDILGGMLQ